MHPKERFGDALPIIGLGSQQLLKLPLRQHPPLPELIGAKPHQPLDCLVDRGPAAGEGGWGRRHETRDTRHERGVFGSLRVCCLLVSCLLVSCLPVSRLVSLFLRVSCLPVSCLVSLFPDPPQRRP